MHRVVCGRYLYSREILYTVISDAFWLLVATIIQRLQKTFFLELVLGQETVVVKAG